MNYSKFVITAKKFETEDTYIFTLAPASGKVFDYQPGQYVYLKNPDCTDPDAARPFSIASSPLNKTSIEICLKQYGAWTKSFIQKTPGSEIYVSAPQGDFTWDKDYPYAVFLLGGIGISPIMSMLRTIKNTYKEAEIVMLYGNRTPETIAYEEELKELQKQIPHLKIIHIFSNLTEKHSWNGYRGFITKEIIQKEANLSQHPEFFYIGPPIFLEKMAAILQELKVPKTQFKTESLSLE